MIILTDLSEVFIRGISGIGEIVAREYGYPAVIEVERRIAETDEAFKNLLRGTISEDDYWRTFFLDGEWPFSATEAKKMLSENMSHEIPFTRAVYEDIVAFPEHTGPNPKIIDGRPELYLVSDHISERLSEVQSLHPEVFKMMTRLFWSCELGMIKSDPDFFPVLLKLLNCRPRDVIFIDDNPKNVTAARRAGIASIQFRHAYELADELSMYGFKLSRKNL